MRGSRRCEEGWPVDDALRRLIELLPPPENPTGREVDWKRYEDGLGIRYPRYFKEFIAVYGASIWFDNYSLFYPEATTTKDVPSFREEIQEKLDLLVRYGMTDENFQSITMPLYPERGGLFPFMIDYDGTYYFWRTEPDDPDSWPLLRWEVDMLRVLKYSTLAEMFLEDIEIYRKMDPDRVCVDRWVPPAPTDETS
jgi:hypothetical protein